MLTPRNQAFVDSYIVCRNATQAAIAAGYSEHTAKQQGSRLLTNADVQRAIFDASQQASARAIVTKEMVLQGLLGLAQDSEAPHSVRRAAWRDLGEHLAMFKLVVNHDRVESLAEQFGLDPAEIAAEAEAILKASR